MKIKEKEYKETYIQLRAFIYQAKRVYVYVKLTTEEIEGVYVKLNKKDLIINLDELYLKDKDNWQNIIDTSSFHFHTKDNKVWYFGRKWLGRPEDVFIN